MKGLVKGITFIGIILLMGSAIAGWRIARYLNLSILAGVGGMVFLEVTAGVVGALLARRVSPEGLMLRLGIITLVAILLAAVAPRPDSNKMVLSWNMSLWLLMVLPALLAFGGWCGISAVWMARGYLMPAEPTSDETHSEGR